MPGRVESAVPRSTRKQGCGATVRPRPKHVMGPGIGEVMATVKAQGIAPTGPWFTYHLRMDPKVFDFEVGVPVATPVAAAGRVRPGRLRAATLARTDYRGPYEGLAAAWGEFEKWIAAPGHESAADLWEYYVVGAESTPDPAGWRTELNWPPAGKA